MIADYYNYEDCNDTLTPNEYIISGSIPQIWQIIDQWKLDLLNLNNEDWSLAPSSWSSSTHEENRLTVINAVENVIFHHMKRFVINLLLSLIHI